jgi:hypothetical protein
MILSNKMKAAAAIGGAAAVLAFTAAPAFASGTPTGNEQITTPVPVGVGVLQGTVPFTPPVDANANPINAVQADLVTGTGYDEDGSVAAMICDGSNPTSSGWSPAADCDSLTESALIAVGVQGNPDGQFTLGNSTTEEYVIFRGQSPNDQFNCLAPADNPNGDAVNLDGEAGTTPAPIDPTVPSWGANTVGANGGGTAPCQVRIAYNPTLFSASGDKFFPLALPQVAPTSVVPESPLTIALPIGGVVLFGAAGAVLYRKRRSHAAA